jgi:hypothetical protein
MNRKKRSSAKTIIIALAILIATAGITAASVLNRKQEPAKVPTVSNAPMAQSTKTYQATSDGVTFEVPETVPKSAIKNYTLITENEQFKIRKDGDDYLITLYAIINRPEQYETYKDQLREYRQNALQYLADQGMQVEVKHITYEPEEASRL